MSAFTVELVNQPGARMVEQCSRPSRWRATGRCARLVMPLAALTGVMGANSSGKSSLYRALRLLVDSSRNGQPPRWLVGEGFTPCCGRARGDRALGAGEPLPGAGDCLAGPAGPPWPPPPVPRVVGCC